MTPDQPNTHLGLSEHSVDPPEEVTLWICDRGHVTTSTLDGACWTCNPGGRSPLPDRHGVAKAQPTQQPFVYHLQGPGIVSRPAARKDTP